MVNVGAGEEVWDRQSKGSQALTVESECKRSIKHSQKLAQEIPGVICQVYLLQHSCFILLSQWGMSIPLTFLLLVISFTALVHLFSDGFSDGFPNSFAGRLSKQFQWCIPVSMVSFRAASQPESSLWHWLPSHHFLSFGSHLGRPAEGNHVRTSCIQFLMEPGV